MATEKKITPADPKAIPAPANQTAEEKAEADRKTNAFKAGRKSGRKTSAYRVNG